MGLMGLLFKVGVECFHVLAWPLFALGYPLCASIQAVETNSKSDTKKLITYWVCFSLILLFEHWFVNLLERWFIKLKEFINQDNLLVEAKRESKETVPDAVEDLLAFGSSTAFNPKLEEAKVVKKEGTSIKQVRQIKPDFTLSGNRMCAPMEMKEMADATIAGGDLRIPDEQHCKNGQMMWTGSVCQETATSTVTDFISPLQGKQHMDACEKLKAKEQAMESNFSSASASFSAPPDSTSEMLQSSSSQTPWTCAVCQVTVTSKTNLVSHFHGRRHKDSLGMLKVKIETSRSNIVAEEMAGSNLPDKLHSNHVQIPWTCGICEAKIKGEASLVSHLQGRRHVNACEKVKALIQKSKGDVSPASLGKKSNSSEEAEKYKASNVCSLKAKRSNKKMRENNKSRSVVEFRDYLWWCTICNINCTSMGNMENHLSGSKHLAKTQK